MSPRITRTYVQYLGQRFLQSQRDNLPESVQEYEQYAICSMKLNSQRGRRYLTDKQLLLKPAKEIGVDEIILEILLDEVIEARKEQGLEAA